MKVSIKFHILRIEIFVEQIFTKFVFVISAQNREIKIRKN